MQKSIKNKELGIKISLSLASVFIIFIIINTIINNYLLLTQIRINEEADIKAAINDIQHNISEAKQKALRISTIYSNLDFVKQAYKDFNSGNDLYSSSSILEKQLEATNKSLKLNIDEELKVHFHLPPARSFYRSWTTKRGDDISEFRETVLNISNDHNAVSGIEMGRVGMVFRGIAPIFDNSGQYLGSVETILPIKLLVMGNNYRRNMQFSLFINNNLLEIATKYKDVSLIQQDSIVQIGNFSKIISTSNSFIAENIDEQDIQLGASDTIYFKKNNYYYAAFPLQTFSGNNDCVVVVQLDASSNKESIFMLRILNLLSGIVFLIIIIPLLFILINKGISVPIRYVVSSISKISKKKINFNISTQRKDEIGDLYNSINSINITYSDVFRKLDTMSKYGFNLNKRADDYSIQILKRAEKASAKMNELSNVLANMVESMVSNNEFAEGTKNINLDIVTMMQSNNATLAEMSKIVEQINNKVKLIIEISEKIDILSVNASIEAARAGQQGKGFAVVANQIRMLSDNTKKVTDDIHTATVRGANISKSALIESNEIVPKIKNSVNQLGNIITENNKLLLTAKDLDEQFKNMANVANSNISTSISLSDFSRQLIENNKKILEYISEFELLNEDNNK